MATLTGLDLRTARLSAGLSRRALAEQCSLHPDTVRYWEEEPRIDLRSVAVERLLAALGLGHLSQRGVVSRRRTAPNRFGYFPAVTRARHGVWGEMVCQRRTPSRSFAQCGAKTRPGAPCKSRQLYPNGRCKNHGGASTGPRTAEGRARIAASNRARQSSQIGRLVGDCPEGGL